MRRLEDGRGEVGVGNGWRAFVDVDVVCVVVAGVTATEAFGVVFVVEVVDLGEAKLVVVVSMAEDEEVSELELGSGAQVEEGLDEPGLNGK